MSADLTHFLYNDAPLGKPDRRIKVCVDLYTVGEDEKCEWVVEFNGKEVARNSWLSVCLSDARTALNKMSKTIADVDMLMSL